MTILCSPYLATGAQEPELQISGRVVEASTGAPISGAKAEPLCSSQETSGRGPPFAITDATGAFGFRGLPADNCTFVASKDGYIPDHGADYLITDDMRLRGVEIRLLRAAQISGIVVVDAEGLRVRRDVEVVAVQVARQADGSTKYLPSGTPGTTDAQGRFTISGLRPDRYLICVACAIWRSDVDECCKNGGSWYGDTRDVTAASAVTVTAGEQRAGLRIIATP